MAIEIGAPFQMFGRWFDVTRQSLPTLESLRKVNDYLYPEGYEVKCDETGLWYNYSSMNEDDPLTGKFRLRLGNKNTLTVGDLVNVDKSADDIFSKKVLLVKNPESDLYVPDTKILDILTEVGTKASYLEVRSFTGGGLYEKGESVNVVLNWEFNQEIESQTINGIELDKNIRTYSFEGISESTDFILKAKTKNDPENYKVSTSVESSVSVIFLSKIYWGVSESNNPTPDEIFSQGSMFSTSPELKLQRFNCTGKKYPWIIMPFTSTIPLLFVNGIINSNTITEELDLVNESGYSSRYMKITLYYTQTGVLSIQLKNLNT